MIQEQIIKNGGDPLDKDKIVKLTMENAALKTEIKGSKGCGNCEHWIEKNCPHQVMECEATVQNVEFARNKMYGVKLTKEAAEEGLREGE